ncbi:MAG: hypothetical protein BroJett006_28380 [Betaproteobacteria bacterium]|nr:MAG: hypothetical protein BroJett006_28380 [Betaproteobacteria bacterium]
MKCGDQNPPYGQAINKTIKKNLLTREINVSKFRANPNQIKLVLEIYSGKVSRTSMWHTLERSGTVLRSLAIDITKDNLGIPKERP